MWRFFSRKAASTALEQASAGEGGFSQDAAAETVLGKVRVCCSFFLVWCFFLASSLDLKM